MNLKDGLDRWLARHENNWNRLLHAVGIPATIVGVVLLFHHSWLLAAACLAVGYVLQVIGHSLEGTAVGELLLIKRIVVPRGGFLKRLLIVGLQLILLVLVGLVIQVLINRLVYFNLHESVGPGMYRSGQMPTERLGEVISRLGIKTVVSLSLMPDDPRYPADEKAVSQNGAVLVGLPFWASKYPEPVELGQMLEVVEGVEPPFLVYCDGGADRTGMFFVLLALREGQSWTQAMRQLSFLRFNYCRLMRSANITLPLYDFSEYARQAGWPRDFQHFRRWLETEHARQAHKSWLESQGK